MNIQLNINMAVAGVHINQPFLTERFAVINHLVRHNTEWRVLDTGMKVHQVEHPFRDELVLEHVFVADIEVHVHALEDAKGFIYSLADVLGQDCIAVAHPSTGHGSLVGSSTGGWGEFDNERFVYMSDVQK